MRLKPMGEWKLSKRLFGPWATQGGQVPVAICEEPREKSDSLGHTPFMYAILCRNTKEAKALFEAGTNIEARDYLHHTPLMLAVEKDEVEIVELLLAAGADKEAKNYLGRTALMLAVVYGANRSLEALLKAGADKEATRECGETILMAAATYDNAYAAKRLVEGGVDVWREFSPGQRAREIAVGRGHFVIVGYLEDAMGLKRTPWPSSMYHSVGGPTLILPHPRPL